VQASGADRLMFGTDHPFFPPLEEGEKEWLSVRTNEKAIKGTFEDDETVRAVMGGNAVRVLKLEG
jgi:aminocarboxymuconate-semialdehyde decarboxylase